MKKTRTGYTMKSLSVMGSFLIALIGLCLFFVSCSSDDAQVPSYYVNLVEADTNQDTLVTVIRMDNGTTYNVTQSIKAATPDTTYRCMCTYAVEDEQLTVYSLSHIFSARPYKAADLDTLITDPVKFISSWRSGGYLNMQRGVMTTDADYHKFAFCEDSIGDKGTYKIAYFTLLHQRPKKDAESYTDNMFLSIPISSYTDCDSFALSVQTYEGLRQVVR